MGGVLFRGWGRLSFLKSGIHAPWMLVSSTRMTWTWLSADAGKAAFMLPGCSPAHGGRGGGGKEDRGGGKEGGQRERPRAVGQLNIL